MQFEFTSKNIDWSAESSESFHFKVNMALARFNAVIGNCKIHFERIERNDEPSKYHAHFKCTFPGNHHLAVSVEESGLESCINHFIQKMKRTVERHAMHRKLMKTRLTS